jgi:hypothetical protein
MEPVETPNATAPVTRAPEPYTWPILAMVAAILPQVLVPAHDRVGPITLVPVIELAVVALMVLIAARPGPVPRGARPMVLTLFGVLVAANTFGAARLVALVLNGHQVDGSPLTADRLLVAGGLALVTNMSTFALLYWQVDGGGPYRRARGPVHRPDFQFPQTLDMELGGPEWMPRFGDYLFLAYTTLVSFAPADASPLTGRAKALMALQSVIALSVIVVVLSRVINILPTPPG